MKRALRAAGLLCLYAAAVWAVDYAAEKPQGYVNDFAGVVDSASRDRLEAYCASLEQATGVQMAIVTVPDLSGEPVEQFANDLFRKWGIGQKGKDNGVLLLLAIADRRSRLELGYGLDPAITDGLAGDVLRSMRPYLRAGQYGDALLEATNQIGERIAQVKGVSLPEPAPRPIQPRPRETGIPPWVVPVCVVVFFLFMRGLTGGGRYGGGMGGFLAGMFLGNLLGGRGGGWGGGGGDGGGGFGGFDSGGGGFGGFGGGDSGGGGASGSW